MRGRRPKTDTLASLEGGYRQGDFAATPSNLLPPDPPEWLCDLAKTEWKRVAPEMHEKGLLSPRDLGTLALYCNIYAQYVAITLQLQEQGLWNEEGKGHSLLGKADALAKQFKTFAVELGFTPSSRGRIVLPPKDTPEDDDFERIERLSAA